MTVPWKDHLDDAIALTAAKKFFDAMQEINSACEKWEDSYFGSDAGAGTTIF